MKNSQLDIVSEIQCIQNSAFEVFGEDCETPYDDPNALMEIGPSSEEEGEGEEASDYNEAEDFRGVVSDIVGPTTLKISAT